MFGILLLQDVFLIDTGKEVFVWIGADASANEKKNGFSYAHVSVYIVHNIYKIDITSLACSSKAFFCSSNLSDHIKVALIVKIV